MLEHYFEKPTRLRQLRRGPLGPHIDDLAAELHGAGYAKSSARFILSQTGKFSRFAQLQAIESPSCSTTTTGTCGTCEG